MEDKFRKEQIVKSEKYSDVRDVLAALLVSGREYSMDEVDSILSGFNERVISDKGSEIK